MRSSGGTFLLRYTRRSRTPTDGLHSCLDGIFRDAHFGCSVSKFLRLIIKIPGGYLSDKYGGKNVLSFGVVAWSLMTFVTPLAASASLPLLLAARALLGVGEGVAMPAMNGMISKWVPPTVGLYQFLSDQKNELLCRTSIRSALALYSEKIHARSPVPSNGFVWGSLRL